MKIRKRYNLNKDAEVGSQLVCPSCGNGFEKTNYQQAFCRSRGGTKCKDKYWNIVTETKRNNTTRISPASANWLASQYTHRYTSEGYKVIDGIAYDEFGDPIYSIDKYNDDHGFSSDGLGQWD